MKALLWQCTLITTLCLASASSASQFENSNFLPEKYLSLKRTKPSLSIVNPLDVLRQRVVLEMARRQRESAIKQAELNREILKSIGKRGNSIDYNDVEEYLRNRYYDTSRGYAPGIYQQQQQPKQSEQNLAGLNKAEPRQQPQQHSSTAQLSQLKAVKGVDMANDANQSQDQIFDDGMIDDDEMQVKYLYSLLKNRIPNSI